MVLVFLKKKKSSEILFWEVVMEGIENLIGKKLSFRGVFLRVIIIWNV